ncbi:putative uncharacterized protein FLJ37770 [Harpegnathos saltator]|uniref:putative uncharacterized protein FLJ37770 n=1 Tax=Harpegnathos saltator TaxID=610380 RepID=UPI000DBEE935|nr:putative uncharacterized protein FLJ37770 [Harpegnathos saltator]
MVGYKRFRKGREDIEDGARSGRPSTSTSDENVGKIEEIVLANRRITIREVAEEIGISYGSCEAIFTNALNMKRFIQQFLTKHNTVVMPQSSYSPDMAPCDFFLFPKLKRTLKG